MESQTKQRTPMKHHVLNANIDGGAATTWNSLVDSFVQAHMKHNMYVQLRMLALDAGESATARGKRFLGCNADTVDLQQSWQHAMDAETRAEAALLDAWSATVATQERLKMALEYEQLPRRVVESVNLHGAGKANACQNFESLVQTA